MHDPCHQWSLTGLCCLYLKGQTAFNVTGLILDFSSVFRENLKLKENINTEKLEREKLLERQTYLNNNINRLRYLLHR